MRGLPSDSFYMITASFKAKICTAFFTANQSTKTNLRKYFDFMIGELFYPFIITYEMQWK